MDELNIYKNIKNIETLKTEETLKEAISKICKNILEYTKAYEVIIYIFDKIESVLIPFLEIGENKKYDNLLIKRKISKTQLEVINLRSSQLHPIDRIQNFIKANKEIYNIDGTFYDDNFFTSYKLSVDNEFLGCLSVIYKPNNDLTNLQNDFISSICKLISILIRNWSLNREIVLENRKRILIENEVDEYLDKSTDLVCVYNQNPELLNLSSSWTRILGWSKEELLNVPIIERVHPEDKGIINNLNDYLLTMTDNEDKKATVKNRYLCKNGSYKWIKWNIEFSQRLNCYFITGKDLTEKIIQEEKKKVLEEKIKLETMKSEIFTNLSHEFKTPLNIILGTMQVMDKYVENSLQIPNDNLNRYLKNIKQNSYRLLKLVNNLTDISKMDVGYYHINLSKNNIVNLIEDICASVVEYAKNKEIDIVFDTDCEEIEMCCDQEVIERVMLNLLSNAIKHSSHKGGKILVNIKDDKDFVFVSVKDNGDGIPKDKLGIIFDRFGQANTDMKDKYEGCGIGLHLVQSLLKLHKGNISVESKEKEGSTFTFSLPKNIKPDKQIKKCDKAIDNSSFRIEKCKIEFSDIYN